MTLAPTPSCEAPFEAVCSRFGGALLKFMETGLSTEELRVATPPERIVCGGAVVVDCVYLVFVCSLYVVVDCIIFFFPGAGLHCMYFILLDI